MAEAKAKIYEAISNVMKDVGVVGKNDKNDFDHYKYRGIDAVMNALNPAMVKHKVFVTPTVLESQREERVGKNGTNMVYSVLTVKYTFYTDDGSSVESVVVGEAMDRSDKSTNKAMAAAFKYACFQVFCIPTEEMIDSETESPEIPPKSAKIRQDTPDEAKANEEMAASVDQRLIPNPKRSPEEREKNIKAEIERTGQDEAKLMENAEVDDWKKLTDAKYVSLLGWLVKRPDKK